MAMYLFTLQACEKDEFGGSKETAAFQVIQEQLFTSGCAVSGCHQSPSDATFAQHKLVLAEGLAHKNLINRPPVNQAAAQAGMSLVKPGDPDKSFLYHKIFCDSYIHRSTENFGRQMPMGGNSVTRGQVELVRRWIAMGASPDDRSLSLAVLKDSVACQSDVEPLAPPTSGFQLKLDLFTIAPDFEREIFVRKNTPNTQTVYVNGIELRGRSNSHHFLVYGFRNPAFIPAENQIRDLRNPDGTLNLRTLGEMQNHIFLCGGSSSNGRMQLPEGAAIRFEPNTPVDLNAHYFNKSKLVLQGENYVNFNTIPREKVKNEVRMLDLGNTNLNLPPRERKTISRNFTFQEKTHILLLTSHNHKYGEKFVIRIFGGPRNGEIIYESTDWEHPLTKLFPTPLILEPGQGLTSEVTYFNSSNRPIGFGFTSEDEMNIIFGYYY